MKSPSFWFCTALYAVTCGIAVPLNAQSIHVIEPASNSRWIAGFSTNTVSFTVSEVLGGLTVSIGLVDTSGVTYNFFDPIPIVRGGPYEISFTAPNNLADGQYFIKTTVNGWVFPVESQSTNSILLDSIQIHSSWHPPHPRRWAPQHRWKK